ncbi:hypothetical protein LIER_42458 [Lithospermum erythrorhizon]|uniref:Uncharacterized protein n=1 Tax=Lithospermum erythrorhizon TaxID=34254 RepID=A0AAV3RTM5_LITER
MLEQELRRRLRGGKLSLGIIEELNRVMAKFLWTGSGKDSGIHWKKWQGWRIVTRQASLLYKILKGRYFHNSNFLNAKVGSNPSFGWRSLIEGRKVLKKEDGG